ncbi:MAG: hypothetical protein KAW17_01050 [Candidatus Eisenbacteria sp.]|nr:hypothetical protein [Candidatus Eisenbacteria bacterium]
MNAAARNNLLLPMVEVARDRMEPGENLALEMYHLPSSALARDGKRLQFLDPWLGLLMGGATIFGENRAYDEQVAVQTPGLLNWLWKPIDAVEDPAERTKRLEEAIALHITYFSITSTVWQKMNPQPRVATEKVEKIYEMIRSVAEREYAVGKA